MNGHHARVQSLLEPGPGAPAPRSVHELLSGRKIYVYGAGAASHWYVEVCAKIFGYVPAAYIDRRFARGDSFEGAPALPPEAMAEEARTAERAVVVVCVGKRELHAEIEASVRAAGFREVVYLHDIYEVHNPFRQPTDSYGEGLAFFQRHAAEIFEALDLMADELSRDVFVAYLETHASRVPVRLPERPLAEQFFPTDVPLARGYSSFICCGCYDGDTVRQLHHTVGRVDEIVCIEPELSVFARLSEYLRREADALAERITALPCAAYSHACQMPFVNAGGLGSRIVARSEAMVQCLSLDEAFPRMRPTFLAVDAEGAEPFILHGFRDTIARCQPDLGLSIYHSPDHLWSLPRYLHGLGVGYQFYLRNYTGFALETVLYATASQVRTNASTPGR